MSFTSPVPVAARWSDVYLAAAARGFSFAGDMLAATALLLALQSRGAGGWAVGALLVASSLPLVVLAPLTGRLVDRFDSRILLVTTGILQAGCCVLMAYTGSLTVLVTLVALVAGGVAVTQPAFAALLPDMVGRENLPRAAAIGQTANAIGMLAGPALAGVLVGQYGLRVPLLLDGVTFLAIAAAGFAIRTRRNVHRVRTGTAGSAVAGTSAQPAASSLPLWRLRDDTILFGTATMIAASVGALSLVNVVDVFFVRETLRASATAYGLIGAVWAAAMLVGAWLTARLRGDDAVFSRAMIVMLGGLAVTVTVVAFVPSIGWLVPLFVVGGVANGGMNTIAGVLLARRAPAQVRGRAQARFGAVSNATNIVGFLLGGALVGVAAPRVLLFGAGMAGILVVAALAPTTWRAAGRDRLAAAGPAEPAEAAEPVHRGEFGHTTILADPVAPSGPA